ncbi:hypothetical protein Ancab_030173 [Ancistrocladus abbreviatus]
MSASSVRRLKERGGAGGKITAVPKPSKSTLTPVSEKTSISAAKSSAGKENSASSISRIRGVSQKPVIRPMPRIDKPSATAAIEGESRMRRSSSSVPRGRSSSPSDFTRLLSDLRKNRGSRVSLGKCEEDGINDRTQSWSNEGKRLNGVRVLEKKRLGELNIKVSENGVNALRANGCSKGNVNVGGKYENVSREMTMVGDGKGLDLSLEKGPKPSTEGRFIDDCSKKVNLCVRSIKSTTNDRSSALDGCRDKCGVAGATGVLDNIIVVERQTQKLDVVLQFNGDCSVEKNGQELSSKGSVPKNVHNLKAMDVCKEKGVEEEGVGGQVCHKYPSKLHEKLAFLEGKVKRIASDIKKTKEMLDMNNPDASKVIISDIQEKISGIEKAMGHVIRNSSNNSSFPKSTEADILPAKTEELNQNEPANCTKVPVKGLNSEELEARLFPHHKLLRDRISLNESSLSSQSCGSNVPEYNSSSHLLGTSLGHIDENTIAMEFLASLGENQSKVIVGDTHVSLDKNKVQETDGSATSVAQQTSKMLAGKQNSELNLMADENLDDFDDQENKPAMIVGDEMDDNNTYLLNEIGSKACTGGWFVSEGESVLLAHADGSCSFYDITNSEEKAEYKPPSGISQNVWRDCWIIRAPGADGCSGKYVVAASAGNTMDSAFCSWDFYTKEIQAFHTEEKTTNTRAVLRPLSDNLMHRRNALSTIIASENQQWWYKPCGPLIVSTASCQKAVRVFDVRDGEQIMRWDVQKPVLMMEYSSPLQWRNRGKVVVAEAEGISLWDINSLNPQTLFNISSSGRKISALHVNNTDAELGGGVRQRVSSSEAEGHDGVFCTTDSINILDFRQPSGIGLKIPKLGVTAQSVFSRGDSIFLGCSNLQSVGKKQVSSQVQEFSLRRQKLVHSYVFPESNAHSHHAALTQVWGNSNLVMGVCGLGLFIFDALRDEGLPSFATEYGSPQKVREIIGPDDLYAPTFDYLSSQILLISRDRPAMWRHL